LKYSPLTPKGGTLKYYELLRLSIMPLGFNKPGAYILSLALSNYDNTTLHLIARNFYFRIKEKFTIIDLDLCITLFLQNGKSFE
jgi:hypothetical protein